MKRKTPRTMLIAALLIALLPALLNAGVRISPAYVEVKLDKGRPSGSFQVTNTSKTPERFRANAIFFTLSEKGGLVRLKDSPFSIAPMIKFNPAEFQLPGNSTRQIRFVILTRKKLQPGEYWAGMEVESLQTQTVKGKDDKGREFLVKVVPSVLVPIFGTVGKVKYAGKMGDICLGGSGEKPDIAALIANEGEGRLVCAAEYAIVDAAGKTVQKGVLGKSYIFRGSKSTFKNHLKPLAAGKYTVKITAKSSQLADTLSGQAQIDWKAPPADKPMISAADAVLGKDPTKKPAGASPDKTDTTTDSPVAKSE